MPAFPHEYASDAEYMIKLLEYNMRVRMWGFIRAAEKVGLKSISTRQVLLLAAEKQCEKMAAECGAALHNETEVNSLLRGLGFPTE